MGLERLDRARTVESIAAVTASGRSPWAGAGLVQHPPRTAGLALGAAVGLPGVLAGCHGELVFPAVDSGGRSVGAGRRNRPCVAGIGIVPARGHAAWTGLQRGLPCVGRIEPVRPVEGGAGPRCRETTPPMVPATVSAIPGLPLQAVDPCMSPAMPPSPRVGHPLHPYA